MKIIFFVTLLIIKLLFIFKLYFIRPDGLVCHRCARRRSERREVLAELLETEVRYGRDLRVLQDELYKPLLVAGLVPLRQLGNDQQLYQPYSESLQLVAGLIISSFSSPHSSLTR